MPHYFFNRVDGIIDLDPEGLELVGHHEARREAVIFAADTLKDPSYTLWDGGEIRIEVMDYNKSLIFTVAISAEVAAVHAI